MVVNLQVLPGASRTALLGVKAGVMRVALAAPPERGRANRALVQLIADRFDVPVSSVSVLRGTTSRLKQVRVASSDVVAVSELVARARRISVLPRKG